MKQSLKLICSIVQIILFILLVSCKTEDHNIIPYYKQNDLVLNGLKGNVKSITDTLFYDATEWDGVWKPDYDVAYDVTTYQYDRNGFATTKSVLHFEAYESWPGYTTHYNRNKDTLFERQYEGDTLLMIITTNSPIDERTYRQNIDDMGLNVRKLNKRSTAVVRLNDDYARARIETTKFKTSKPDDDYMVIDTYAYDTTINTITFRSEYDDEEVVLHYKILGKDKYSNPTLILQEQYNDKNPGLLKRRYEYY